MVKNQESLQAELATQRNETHAKEEIAALSAAKLEVAQQEIDSLERSKAILQARVAVVEAEKRRLQEVLADADERVEGHESYLADMVRRQRQQCEEMEQRVGV